MLRIDFKIDPQDKHYPLADEWMWSYCIFLGKFVCSDGKKCDLGVHIEKFDDGTVSYSDATVWGPEGGQYSSGEISKYMWDSHDSISTQANKEAKREVYRRARALGIINF